MGNSIFLKIFIVPGILFILKNIGNDYMTLQNQTCIGSQAKNQTRIVSGVYGDVSISFDSGRNLVTGVYEYYDKWNPKYKDFTDINVFYFFGQFEGDSIVKIKAGWPGISQRLFGKIIFSGNSSIRISLNDQPYGYNAVNFRKLDGVEFNFSYKKDWKEIRMVKNQRAHLFDLPDSAWIRKGYLVKDDIVKILSFSNKGWAEIEYSSPGMSDNVRHSWIRKEVLFDYTWQD
jgi:hypothetical protein